MKSKLLCFVMLTALTISMVSNSIAGDRRVIVERFTSSTCPPCATYNPTLDAFLNATNVNDLISISYHMNWPAPGNDPMYLANPNDNNARRTNYNVNYIPNWKFDGVININGFGTGELQSSLAQRKDILSPISMIVKETRNGNTVNAVVEIYCESPVLNPNAILHFVVLEKMVTYSFPPGTNGESNFADVMRKMLPSALGTPVTLLPGRKITVEYSYTISNAWVADQVRSVAFVQSSPLEILNTGIPTLDFNLISSPAYKTVAQGQNNSADFKAFIPSVAEAFNSAVTFTAEVQPSNAGITVNFPNGNVISNFPDSVAFRVSSTAAVPVGEYKVVVTGTSATGVVHKTVVNYLVGKNYVIIGPSRNNVSLVVDNVSYNTSRLFTWDLGSNHDLNAPSPQTFGNNRYVYRNWSNGGSQSQTVSIDVNTNSLTATYGAQFRMLGQLEPQGIPVTVNGSGSYFDSASAQNVTLSAQQVQFNGKTYYFNRWEGIGSGSYSGPNPTAEITVNAVIVQKAIFDTINVGISNYNSLIPSKYELYQNFPNPFNPTTSIRFDLPKSSFVSIAIYDMTGRQVTELVNTNLNAGAYEYNFNATSLSSGVYYYSINAANFSSTKRMMLIK
ncbi:MAG: T9SS type A sorting domain-containing protein [Ignavibacteria bacterium]|nr:T9SS type A sorting domain-containing protein [Ignavibacteria bacterium]